MPITRRPTGFTRLFLQFPVVEDFAPSGRFLLREIPRILVLVVSGAPAVSRYLELGKARLNGRQFFLVFPVTFREDLV